MGNSMPRPRAPRPHAPGQQPGDAQEAGDTWDELGAEPAQDAQTGAEQPPDGDDQGPKSKFNG
jgi:hypothetical protein